MSNHIETARFVEAGNSLSKRGQMLSIEQILQNKQYTKSAIDNRDYERLFYPAYSEATDTRVGTALVLLSGGIDSTAMLWLAKSYYPHVIGVEYDYIERPEIERRRVREISKVANIDMYTIEYPKATIVQLESDLPNLVTLRESNVIYYILAGNLAMKLAGNKEDTSVDIVAGQILSDWLSLNDFDKDGLVSYEPQASPSMYKILNLMLQQEYGKGHPVIKTPLIYASKRDVVRMAKDLSAPLELAWSCPKSSVRECGNCAQCIEKIDAFSHNGLQQMP